VAWFPIKSTEKLTVAGIILANSFKAINSGYNSKLTLENSGTGGSVWELYSGDNSTSLFGSGANLAFYQGGSTKMILTSTGNLLLKTTTDIASSALTINSNSQGILIPRMTITERDAIAEGVECWIEDRLKSKPIHYKVYYHEDGDDSTYSSSAITSYETLWQKINGKDSWNLNPWVWVIEFKQIQKP